MWLMLGNIFKSIFLEICDKHAPLRRFWVSGRNNPWFNESVSNLIKQRNVAWSKAKKQTVMRMVQYRLYGISVQNR